MPVLPQPLRRTASVDDFLERPLGAALVGDGFVYAWPRRGLFVVSLFGRPDAENARPLLRALKVELEDRVPPHASIVDASRVKGVDADAFTGLATYVSEHHAALRTKVTRLCLVRPQGLSGAVVAGFFSVVDPPYPVLVTARVEDAPAFLGDAAPLSVVAEVNALVAHVAEKPAVVARVEGALLAEGFSLELADVARVLGLSPRTLQRRLAGAHTSFLDVQRAARLAEARRRLLDTAASVTTIAFECGWSSPQHFAADFRAAHGVTPSAWRRRT